MQSCLILRQYCSLIDLIKKLLKKAMAKLIYNEMWVVLVQVEHVINSRPLMVLLLIKVKVLCQYYLIYGYLPNKKCFCDNDNDIYGGYLQ